MTKAQNALYWRLWRLAAQANDWPMSDAEKRHAVHHSALGYDKSHFALTNKEFDRVIMGMRLAADAEDLEAVMFFQDPSIGTRVRMENSVRQFPPALTIKICRDKFAKANWQDLNVTQLGQLLMTLKRIRSTWNEQMTPPPPIIRHKRHRYDAANAPF